VANEDFINFEKALGELQLTEEQLKRLVSEGEIRAIRGENNSMRFRREEIERLKQDTGKTLQYTEESSETLTDDLLFDEAEDLDVDEEGMATAQISSDDTFVGDDGGMTTEPLGPPAAVAPRRSAPPPPARPSTGGVRRTTGRSTRIRAAGAEQQATGIGMGVTALLILVFLVLGYTMFVWYDVANNSVSGVTNGIVDFAGENFAKLKR
jgi:hypothetical protein